MGCALLFDPGIIKNLEKVSSSEHWTMFFCFIDMSQEYRNLHKMKKDIGYNDLLSEINPDYWILSHYCSLIIIEANMDYLGYFCFFVERSRLSIIECVDSNLISSWIYFIKEIAYQNITNELIISSREKA